MYSLERSFIFSLFLLVALFIRHYQKRALHAFCCDQLLFQSHWRPIFLKINIRIFVIFKAWLEGEGGSKEKVEIKNELELKGGKFSMKKLADGGSKSGWSQ